MRPVTSVDVFELEAHRFCAEASTLGLPPGSFPKVIETTLGNGQPLVRESAEHSGGELVAVNYWQTFGCVCLRVLND